MVNIMSNQKQLFKVGIYIRLSREDGDKEESSSVTNQREILKRFIKENKELLLIKEYVDDGYSGTNFDRPAFKQMQRDIEKGVIDTVITKDLSRLGRDYIDTGRYVQRYFPEHKVRYMALLDGIDTLEDAGMNDMAPFKSIINDMYVKDISKKVKSAVHERKRAGNFLGTTAPYGYMKDPANKYHLIINEDEAKIVREAFDLYLQGNGLTKIAQIFTEKGYEVPGLSRKIRTENKTAMYSAWKQTTISRILKNRTYIGDLEQLKRTNLNYKSKIRLTVPKENRIVCEGTHEAIISKEDFERVQKIMSGNTSFKGTKHDYLLKGLLYCAECGARLQLSYSYAYYKKHGEYKYTTVCYTYSKLYNNACTRHANSISAVEKVVLDNVKAVCKKYIKNELTDDMVKMALKQKESEVITKDCETRINELEKKMEHIDECLSEAYKDKISKLITLEQFQSISKNLQEEKEKYTQKRDEYLVLISNEKCVQEDTREIKKLAKDFVSMKKITKELLSQLIDKITITEDNIITIHYKFKDLNSIANEQEIIQHKSVFGRGTSIK